MSTIAALKAERAILDAEAWRLARENAQPARRAELRRLIHRINRQIAKQRPSWQ